MFLAIALIRNILYIMIQHTHTHTHTHPPTPLKMTETKISRNNIYFYCMQSVCCFCSILKVLLATNQIEQQSVTGRIRRKKWRRTEGLRG